MLSTATFGQKDVTGGFELKRTLLENIADALGVKHSQAIEERVVEIEDEIRPLFAAMPQNENQRLGRSAVRYVLYRFFMRRGWSIRGLEPAGETWNSGSPTKILQDHVPENVQHFFEKELVAQGFNLREVAIFAATFKYLVRNEMIEKLRAAYRANNLPYGGILDEESTQQVLDAYMATIIVGSNISAMSPNEVHKLVKSISDVYPPWHENRKFVQMIKQSVIRSGTLNFPSLKRVIEQVEDRFGAWRTDECMQRKHELMALEDHSSGRVRLSEFYRSALHDGKFHFGENTDYLRQLGALDETVPYNLRVIIPNWVNSISNCMEASQYYSICCINECDELFAQFERKFKAPTASPTEIVTFAAALPSESVVANRTLPASLIRRVSEIAENNGGRVPLHGRLFSQWMHHAYPRECPFPHVSGTTNPLRVSDWEKTIGTEVVAKEEEMLQHIDAAAHHRSHSVELDDEGECAPWMEDEELLDPLWQAIQSPAIEHDSIQWTWLASCIVLFVLLVSGGIKLAKPNKGVSICADKHEDQVPVYFI